MDQLPSDFVLISLGKFETIAFGRFAIVALPIMTLIIGWFALMLIRHQRSSHPRRQESPKGIVMPDPSLVLRRANVSRPSGAWKEEDFDVFDGERDAAGSFESMPPLRSGGGASASRSSAARVMERQPRSLKPKQRSRRNTRGGKSRAKGDES